MKIKTPLELKLILIDLGIIEFQDRDWIVPITGWDLEDDFVNESSQPGYVKKLAHDKICRETGKCSHCHPHKGIDVPHDSIVRRNWKQYRRYQQKQRSPRVRFTRIHKSLLVKETEE